MTSGSFLKIFITVAIISIAIFLTVRYKYISPQEELSGSERTMDSVVYFLDLESPQDLQSYDLVTDKFFKSANHSAVFNESIEYGVTFFKRVKDIPDFKFIREVHVEMDVFSENPLKDASIVLTIEKPGSGALYWSGDQVKTEEKTWSHFLKIFFLKGSDLDLEGEMKIYVWNKGKESFYFDDLKITLK